MFPRDLFQRAEEAIHASGALNAAQEQFDMCRIYGEYMFEGIARPCIP